MEDLQLISFNDPLLKKIPADFDFEENDAKDISEKLHVAMVKTGGIGISANQVGLDMKVFVINKIGDMPGKTFFNPELIGVSNQTTVMREGCLSYPGLWLMIKRPVTCALKYYNEDNEEIVEEFSGIPARVILHEYDHMVGQNFTMRASKLKIQRALKSMDKKVKNYKRKNSNVR